MIQWLIQCYSDSYSVFNKPRSIRGFCIEKTQICEDSLEQYHIHSDVCLIKVCKNDTMFL